MSRGRVMVATAAVGCLLAASLVAPAPSPAAAAPADALRIGFTDDRDQLATVGLMQGEGDVLDVEPGDATSTGRPTHEGEASTAPDGAARGEVFVSTRPTEPGANAPQDPDGEVYLTGQVVADQPSGVVPVTCDNDAHETHPVVHVSSEDYSTKVSVLYATDDGADWDIVLATRIFPYSSSSPSAEASPAPAPDCEGWTTRTVTPDPAGEHVDDLWPAWLPDGDGFVCSSAGPAQGTPQGIPSAPPDPLGDLYLHPLGPGRDESQVQRLTDDPAADTQPSVGVVGASTVVAFSTTRWRRDGSIGLLEVPDPSTATPEPTPPPPPTVHSAWAGYPPQGEEPSLTSQDSYVETPYLAYTSTEDDPYGDVWVARLAGALPTVAYRQAVAARPGVAESHPAWSEEFDTVTEAKAVLAFTRRSTDADVGDVSVGNRSDRRRLIDGVADEAGPSYSPDGTSVVYSAGGGAGGPGPDPPPRQLMIADADGSGPRRLLTGPPGDDIDEDPVWSPDGRHVAFTRYVDSGDGFYLPQVWVVDIDGAGTGVQPRALTAPAAGQTLWDLQPSWAPDSRHLVIARSEEDDEGQVDRQPAIPRRQLSAAPAAVASGASSAPVSRVQPKSLETGQATSLWVVDASGAGPDEQLRFRGAGDCGCSVPVFGRSPAWSPDGATIAFSDAGALQVVDVSGARSAGGFADLPRSVAVTGFDDRGDPTPSRPSISAAEDPAWSRDGSRIAFTGQPAGQPDQRGIYAISPDGTGLQLVADERGPESEPAWNRVRGADVAVAVRVDGSPAAPGAPLTATYDVTNHGTGVALDVELAASATTSAGVGGTAVATDPAAGCRADGSGCSFAALTPGETRQYVVTLVYAAPVSGVARGRVTTTSKDVDTSNDEASADFVVAVVPVVRGADVAVTVGIGGSPTEPGGPVTATYGVTNLGRRPARAVVLRTLATPGGTAVASDPATGCRADGSGCSLGTLGPGEARRYVVTLIYPTALEGTARGRVTTASRDADPSNDEASAGFVVAAVPLVPGADAAVTVAVTGSPAEPGAPVTATYTVANRGTGAALDVALTTGSTQGGTAAGVSPPQGCRTDGSGCSFGLLASGEVRQYVVTLTYPAAVDGVVNGAVTTTSRDVDPSNDRVRAPFRIATADVSVRLLVDRPPTAYVGGIKTVQVVVRNEGEQPAVSVSLVMSYATGILRAVPSQACLTGTVSPCRLGDLSAGARRTLLVPLRMTGAGIGLLTAAVASRSADATLVNNFATTSLTVVRPTIRLLPAVARPGEVTMAYGENMPPRTFVRLRWTSGITVDTGPFEVDADGTMRAPLVLVRHDLLGSRQLTATSTTRQFSPVRGPMLVLERLATPPSLISRG